MDDFTLKVRQIAQYPLLDFLQDADRMLVQQGGLGGPYRSVAPQSFFRLGNIAVGLFPAPNLQGLVSSILTTPLGARQGFNWYVDQDGNQRYLQNGVAGQWRFAGGELSFSIAPQGFKDDLIESMGVAFTPLLQLGYDGNLKIAQQITVGRGPVLPNEVATLEWIRLNTIAAFNGRTGAITLTGADVETALGVESGDALATQCSVSAAITSAINDWYRVAPFVYTFNGRVGDICLLATDVSKALFADPQNSTAPTPPLGDISNKIATTAFVDDAIADLHTTVNNEFSAADQYILNLLTGNYAPLNSPDFSGIPTAPTAMPGNTTSQLATTAFVMAAVTSSTTGVVSFNGRQGAITTQASDITSAGGALLNSPIFTGVPQAPTAPIGTNSNQVATCAWVLQEVGAISSGVTTFNGRAGDIVLTLADVSSTGAFTNTALLGVPTAPTAAPGTSTQQLATTAFVAAAVLGSVASWNGRTGNVTMNLNDITAAGGAPISSPSFSGTPSAPTAPLATNDNTIATTMWVRNYLATLPTGVATWNGRAGAVTMALADLLAAGGPVLTIADAAPTGAAATAGQAFWWDSVGGQLYVRFNDGTSTQWVVANNQPGAAGPQGPVGPAGPAGPAGGITYAAATFTGNGTYTTPPDSSTATVYRVRMQGAGGGAQFQGDTTFWPGAGGAGEYKEFMLSGLAPSTALTLTVPPGATGGTGPYAGSPAAADTVLACAATGSNVVCNGGAAGQTTSGQWNWSAQGGRGGATAAGSATITALLTVGGQDGGMSPIGSNMSAGPVGGFAVMGFPRAVFNNSYANPVSPASGYGYGGSSFFLQSAGAASAALMQGGPAIIIIERIQG